MEKEVGGLGEKKKGYQVEKASNPRLIGLPEEERRFKDIDGEHST